MNAKETINFFVAGHVADVIITYTALTQLDGFQEIGPAGQHLLAEDSTRLLIGKLAVTAMLIGIYALSREKSPKVEFIGRKSMEYSMVVVYLVLTSNVIQVTPELIKHLGY